MAALEQMSKQVAAAREGLPAGGAAKGDRGAEARRAALVARKHAAGKSTGEALRCLERHLARTVWQYNLEAVKRTAASKWTVDAKRGAAQRYILMAPSGRTP